MTPTQRAAAERLADELQRFDGAERESLRDEATALLRELAAESVHEVEGGGNLPPPLVGGMTLPPLPARWYCVSRDGLATLCASEQNAIEMAADCARDYPRQAPYRAVLMCDVAAERERCAAICDQRSADHWRAYSDKSSPHFCDARFEAFSDEAEECAKLIRGDNVELSGLSRTEE